MEAVTMKTFLFLVVVIASLTVAIADPQGGGGRRKKPNANREQQHQESREPDYANARQKFQGTLDIECPEPNGFFADSEQCDKYYACQDGVATPKLCPDGLAFLEAGSKIEKCEFPFAIDCTGRNKFQPAQPSQNCPRKHGYFAHEDTKICDKFFFCVDGTYNAITCPSGLVFNDKTGTCTWPDLAKKAHCSSGELFSFDCPKLKDSPEPGSAIHPRFADPKDCQYFYVCIDGLTPRRSGCSTGQVFNEVTGQCDKPKNVPECKDWYKGILDYDEDGELRTTPKPLGASGTRRKQQGGNRKN